MLRPVCKKLFCRVQRALDDANDRQNALFYAVAEHNVSRCVALQDQAQALEAFGGWALRRHEDSISQDGTKKTGTQQIDGHGTGRVKVLHQYQHRCKTSESQLSTCLIVPRDLQESFVVGLRLHWA